MRRGGGGGWNGARRECGALILFGMRRALNGGGMCIYIYIYIYILIDVKSCLHNGRTVGGELLLGESHNSPPPSYGRHIIISNVSGGGHGAGQIIIISGLRRALLTFAAPLPLRILVGQDRPPRGSSL